MGDRHKLSFVYGKLAAASVLAAAFVVSTPVTSSAVTISIKNNDLPGKGFNDTAHVSPVGGNPGTTLGAQRLYLFQRAADMWGQRLAGNVPVVVSASFSAQ